MNFAEKKTIARRWLRFLLGGGINTAFTYGVYIALNLVMGYQSAYLIAYSMGVVFAYWFNAVLVFRVPLSWKGFFSYPLVYVIQYGASALLLGALVEVGSVSETLAPLVVTVGMVPLTYVLSKRVLRASSCVDKHRVSMKKMDETSNFWSPHQIIGRWLDIGCSEATNDSLTENSFMQNKWQRKIIWILVFFPIFSLVVSGISWLRFGIDIPFKDDWRDYDSGNMGSVDLRYLFKSANDTLYPVGKALDSLAYRYLDGNAVAYQFISMISVLGLLLLLQWRLLLLALNDRLMAASAFSLTLLMLQPDTYWGYQNMAYHQAIPLLASLASVYVVLRGNWRSRWGVPALLILGLISGFSYISGAFAILALSITFLLLHKLIDPTECKPLFVGGLSLLAVGLISTLAQLWVIIVVQKGTSRPKAPMAWPSGSDFWFYMLGKVARSLMLPLEHPVFSLMLTGAILILTFALIFWTLRLLIKNKTQPLKDARPALIFVSIFSVIFVYLMLISAGRANCRPAEANTSIQIFSSGFPRFHFFWVTLLWPWVAAVSLIALGRFATYRVGNLQRKAALIMPMVTIPFIVYAGALNHSDFFKNTMERRIDGVKCLINGLQKGKSIHCPQIRNPSLEAAFFNGKDTGASFARVIPILPISIGTDDPPPIFRMPKNWQSVEIKNALYSLSSPEGIKLEAGNDPMIFFKTGAFKKMGECKTLDVAVSIRVSQSDKAQLYYRVPGQVGFTEAASRTTPIDAGASFKEIFFIVNSLTGFVDDLRVDPVMKPQQFELKELEVRCRRSA